MIKSLLSLFTIPTLSTGFVSVNVKTPVEVTPYAYIHTVYMHSDLKIEKGWSGGDASDTENKEMGNYKNKFGVTYDRLRNEEFILTVTGSFETYTKSSGTNNQGKLILSKTESTDNHIICVAEQYSHGEIGWGNQKARIKITVEIKSDTDVILTNYVYAGAWGTVSYAHANSKVETLSLFIYKKRLYSFYEYSLFL